MTPESNNNIASTKRQKTHSEGFATRSKLTLDGEEPRMLLAAAGVIFLQGHRPSFLFSGAS